MASVWASKRPTQILGGVAILFGIATLISGGRAIVALHGIPDPTAKTVPFVLYFNFAAGIAYMVAGAGLILQRKWAPALAVAIALATTIVFLGLGAWILTGNAYEVRTVLAMVLRTVFWLGAGVAAVTRSRAVTALSAGENDLPSA